MILLQPQYHSNTTPSTTRSNTAPPTQSLSSTTRRWLPSPSQCNMSQRPLLSASNRRKTPSLSSMSRRCRRLRRRASPEWPMMRRCRCRRRRGMPWLCRCADRRVSIDTIQYWVFYCLFCFVFFVLFSCGLLWFVVVCCVFVFFSLRHNWHNSICVFIVVGRF